MVDKLDEDAERKDSQLLNEPASMLKPSSVADQQDLQSPIKSQTAEEAKQAGKQTDRSVNLAAQINYDWMFTPNKRQQSKVNSQVTANTCQNQKQKKSKHLTRDSFKSDYDSLLENQTCEISQQHKKSFELEKGSVMKLDLASQQTKQVQI